MKTSTSSREGLVQLRCVCGKRLRVSDGLHRKDVRCTDCEEQEDRALLKSFGIDPDAARASYEQERRRRFRCSRCARRLVEQELPPDADAREDDLLCGTCHAAAVEQRAAPAEKPRSRKPAAVAPRETAADVRRRAWAYGGLFFLGVAGFMSTIVGTGAVLALLIASVAAVAGGRATWTAYADGTAAVA